MIEDFFHQIETELGPLSSDWFKELTAKASKDESFPGAVEHEALSRTEDGTFRAPQETPALESQMSSTPRLFRVRGPLSPDSVLGRSPNPGMQTPLSTLPWTDSSPCLFGSAKESQRFEEDSEPLKKHNYFGLLDTPKSSLVQDSSAKRISESLGAQLHPDLSWSSNFNTPGAMSPTVILTKKDAQPSPVSFLKDKEVIIVRKLFPSLSKGTESTSEITSTAHYNASLTEENAQTKGPDESFDNVEGLWRQTVPDAINDSDVRDTVESVLDGAEDVLSIFFSNSSSALRRVKSKERTKKRVNGVSEDVKPAALATQHSTDQTDQTLASNVDLDINSLNSSSTCTATEAKSPPKNKDFSQWSPLSLSQVSDAKAKQDCTSDLANKHLNFESVNSDSGEDALKDSITQLGQFNTCEVEKQKSSPDSYPEKSQLRSSLLAASPALTFSRKPRKFVYQVQSPFPPTKERKRNNAQESSLTTTDDLTGKHYREPFLTAENKKHIKDDPQTSDTVGDCLVHPKEPPVKQGNPGALNVDHGLDMTQLCNAFAEDFTQEISLEKSAVNTECDNDVHTMSTCMSDAIKIDEVQTKAESVLHSDDGAEHLEFPANHKEASALAEESINLTSRSRMENTLSESLKHENGYPAVFNDVSGLSSSCNDGADKYLYSGFKTANNKLIHVPPEAVMKAKATFEDFVDLEESMNTAVRSDGLNTGSGTALNSSVVSTWSSERYSHALNKPEREPTGNLLHGSLDVASGCTSTSYLPKTNDSGFKTASNRSITISSVNLEKAKDIFKELEVENLYKTDICPSSNSAELEIQVMKNAKVPKLDIKRNVDGNYVLTASQKADVTELCSMLEDADSQYEFTQFRQAKPCSKSMESSRSEREWDPEILSGIDFDDSFNCDTERQLPRKWPVRPDLPTQNGPVSNSMKNGEVFTQSKETPKAELSLNDYRLTLRSDGREMAKTPAVQTNTSEGNEPVCVGFKTARGNSVRISEKNLTKARSLFADLEDCVGKIGLKSDHNSVTAQVTTKQTKHNQNSPEACGDGLLCQKEKTKTETGIEPRSEENVRNGNTSLVTDNKDDVCKQICSTENPEDQDNPQGTKQNEKPDLLVDTRHCGFSTAGGKELKVSESSLLKAKKLLNKVSDQCEAVPSIKAPPNRVTTLKVANINLQPSVCSNSKVSENVFPHNLKMSCKSLTGNSKDQMFRNSESHHRLSEIEHQTTAKYQSTKSIQSSGFKMASCKGVSFSSSAIEKSRAIFRDLDSLIAEDGSNETKSMDENAKLHDEAERSQCKFANGFKMASGKGVSFSEGAFLKSKAFFKDCDADYPDHSQGKGDQSSVMDNCGFKALVGNTVHLPEIDSPNKEIVGLKDEATVLNKYVEKEFVPTSAPEILQFTSGCGFSTASGKMVSVSAEALQKAKAVLDDSSAASPCEIKADVSEEKNKKGVPKTDTYIPGRSLGFSTASGRKVAISDRALEKAKNLFASCEVEDLANNGITLNSAQTKPLGSEQTRCLGFSTASGKGVAVSEKTLKEAKAVFAGCEDILETADVHKPLKTGRVVEEKDKGSLNQSLTNREFQTCESANFRLSSGKCEEINNANKSNVKVEQFGFSTASGKGVSVSKSALKVAFEMFRDCDVQPITEEQHPVAQIDCPSSSDETRRHTTDTTTLSLSTQAIRDDSSLLNSHALSLNGCTMTQQKYLEQEAMACTKALLEDDFNEHSRSEPVEETVIRKCPTLAEQRSYEVIIGERKRTSDADLTGQPPLKRRLISEFDQISDGTRVCVPVKSSPNGTLTDRRVFKGNVHLKPNITHPSRNIMDQNASKALDGEKRRPSNPKAVIFIPPFQKNIKPTRKVPTNYVSRDNAKVPTMFIPPVKKNPMSNVLQGNSIQSCTDSDCEKLEKEDTLEVKPNTAGNHDSEPEKKEKEVEEDVRIEDRASVTCEEKDNESWSQSLELARDMQDMRIRKKKRQTIRPLPGSIYLAKTSGVTRISLREAVNNKCPLLHSQEKLYQYGVHCQVSQITAENAELFRFNFDDFFKREMFIDNTGVQLADGGWLIPDNRGTVGKEEFYKAMCDTPGVDPKLMSEAWVFNHYRWVVWKRACMERTFPEVMGGRCLTPEQVLLQLKLRYDTEVDNSRRSALKKIMERDDTPAKTLVLAVCGFAKSSSSPVNSEKAVGTPDSKTSESTAAIIWLTDGWYSIKALLDPPLSSMLQKGRLSIGGKVMIHGAELIGSQDACLPLEAPDSLMLKISANSTRRARWDSKLGFYKDPRPFSLPLSSLYSNGGVVGCVDVIVLRSYPTQWMEKRTGGVFVFRNERAEDREARRHSSAKQKTMELLFTRIQAQFEKEEEEKKKTRRRKRFRRCDIHSMQDGEELYEAMENDPAYVEAHLSAQQMEAVSSYRRVMADRRQVQLQERMQKSVQEAQESEGLCPNRDVTPVWKLTIADFSDLHSNCTYTLNIWRPSLELRSLLKEGCRYKAYYLSTSETKKRSGTANVQFTATKKTQFQDIEVCPEWLMANFPARQFTIFRDLQNSAFSSPCGEVDVVGYVISILDRQGASPVLYLVDDKFDFVSVRSFSSLVQLALEDLVKPLTLLAISNLQLRELSGPVPRLYAGEQALFSVNPKEAHLQEAMAHLKTFVQSYENFFSVAEEKLSNLLPSGSVKPAQSPRTLGLSSVPKLNSRINVTPQPPKVHSPFTPVSRRAPTPTDQTTEPKDPKSLKRKRGIDFLSRVPSPPPLNPLNILTSPNVKKTFNPPRRSETNRPARRDPAPSRRSASLAPSVEEQWVNDEELAMINTQTLLD
ncbi:breast cancer type 2 susceptibility protein isoform X1 [Astyanax mexicanus]|uniref:breast cancer type 2 susceptibility protein isoform X1 n=1 Tax=Astyanax mexicanus TaxID=7994 RepID=UPI0020CAAB3E|nr:breast cancer type 2 susceptibility protein isoform X1 [Astyanax mexicanus]